MPYELTIGEKSGVLWATATGTRSVETVLAMSKQIMAACKDREIKRALLDVRGMDGHLSTMEAYEIPATHFPKIRDRSVLSHIAIIDREENRESNRFFETVAVNRGFRVRLFTDADKALHWLKE